MKRVVAISMAAVAACSSGESVDVPPVPAPINVETTLTQGMTSAESSDLTTLEERFEEDLDERGFRPRSDGVYGVYEMGNFGIQDMAEVQEFIGIQASAWMIENGPFDVAIDGEKFSVSFAKPDEGILRTVAFVETRADIESAIGVPVDRPYADQTFRLDEASGQLFLTSVQAAVHQEIDTLADGGPFGGSALALCSSQDMIIREYNYNNDEGLLDYRDIQFGACGAMASVVDNASIGYTYDDYYQRLPIARSVVTAEGRTITFAELTRFQYADLKQRISN